MGHSREEYARWHYSKAGPYNGHDWSGYEFWVDYYMSTVYFWNANF